ncbi:hypothetical protein TNCV_339981 [Trichonephila clavipes]|nr:hypothetical protein TNCV_339981 [Trichonephila clavipes]
MNSPDFDVFIFMFSAQTPVSPLPPTPVASPSHEASQDEIHYLLPPMEQTTFPESHLKHFLLVNSKPPVFSKPPVVSIPPVVSKPCQVSTLQPIKKVAVKKFDSVIHQECS